MTHSGFFGASWLWPVRRVWFFLSILWRPWVGGRMDARTAWAVAKCLEPRKVSR